MNNSPHLEQLRQAMLVGPAEERFTIVMRRDSTRSLIEHSGTERELAAWLAAREAEGFRVISRIPSWHPCLQDRDSAG